MATKLSMSDPNPGIWFKFDDNDPESGDIGIRPLNQAKRDEIRKKAIKKRIEYKHGQRFEVEELDDDKFSELLWDYSITGWNNLEDDDGPIPVTPDGFDRIDDIGFLHALMDGWQAAIAGQTEVAAPLDKSSKSGITSGDETPAVSLPV
jgi:hypothetical protein